MSATEVRRKEQLKGHQKFQQRGKTRYVSYEFRISSAQILLHVSSCARVASANINIVYVNRPMRLQLSNKTLVYRQLERPAACEGNLPRTIATHVHNPNDPPTHMIETAIPRIEGMDYHNTRTNLSSARSSSKQQTKSQMMRRSVHQESMPPHSLFPCRRFNFLRRGSRNIRASSVGLWKSAHPTRMPVTKPPKCAALFARVSARTKKN